MTMGDESRKAEAPDPIRRTNTDGDSRYALEKLNNIVYSLATHPGPIKQRLHSAIIPYLFVLRNEDFPGELAAEWEWIKSRLTRKGPLRNPNGEVYLDAVANTFYRIHSTTVAEIARRIWELRSQLKAEIDWIEEVDRQGGARQI
jgi:hypothetical protein